MTRQVHRCRFPFRHTSFFSLLFVHPFRHLLWASYQAGILSAASRAVMADVELVKKILPSVTCEITFGQDVCEWMFGINVSTLYFRVKIYHAKQPIQSNSVDSWQLSHCGTSAFYYHPNQGFIVLKDVHNIALERNVFRLMERDQYWSNLWSTRLVGICFRMFGRTTDRLTRGSLTSLVLLVCFLKNEILQSLNPKDREREYRPCVKLHRERNDFSFRRTVWNWGFLHIRLFGTNVWLPKMHRIPPDVGLESSKSPAKSESWNNPNLQCCAVAPQQYCRCSHVWWMYAIKRAKR